MRQRTRRATPAAIAAVVVAAGVPLALVGVFFVVPVLAMLGLGLGIGVPDAVAESGGSGLGVLVAPRTLRLVALTLGMAGAATTLALALGLPAAWVLHRLRFPGRALLRLAITVPFVLPTVVVGVAFRSLFAEAGPLGALGLDGTVAAVVVALAFFNIAVVARTVGVAWAGLDDRQEQAAALLGATPWRVLRTVTLPRLAPAVLAAAAIVFLFCSTAFGLVLVLGGPGVGTIETEIFQQAMVFFDLPAASALALAQLVLVVGVLLFAARARRRASAVRSDAGAVADAGAGRPPRRATRRDLPVIGVVVVTAAALAVPMVVLVARSLRTRDGVGIDHYLALATGGNGIRPVWDALGASLVTAAVACAIAIIAGIGAAVVLSRRPRTRSLRRLSAAFDHALMLPLGVSAVTVGLGILVGLGRPPLDLRAWPGIVPIAQALVALPIVVRTILPALTRIDPRLRESAALLGAPPWRVLLDVDARRALPAIGTAAGFAFAVCLGEFGATSFLARPDTQTLPVVIARLAGAPGLTNQGMAMAASVLLAAVTVGVMALVDRAGSRSAVLV